MNWSRKALSTLAILTTLGLVAAACGSDGGDAVSYTHLTLPTILLV